MPAKPLGAPVAPVADASSARGASPDGGPLLGAPPWPPGVARMRLTWVIYPVVIRNNSTPVRRVELVLRVGEVSQRLDTEVALSVAYAVAMQPDCHRRPGEVIRSAELDFNGGGNVVLVADRHGDELWLSEVDSSDGLCEPSPCPRTTTLRGRMAVPSGVAFDERFHIVDGAGAEHDEVCQAR